jgi:hypothetical protein
MFASAEAVDAKIDAIAGKVALPDVAHLDRIGHAAAGFDGKIGKDRMSGLAVGDLEKLRARAEAAAVDLIFIGGPPIMNGRRLKSLRIVFHGVKHFPNAAGILEAVVGNYAPAIPRLFTNCVSLPRNPNPNNS